jgi:hypothetical protein
MFQRSAEQQTRAYLDALSIRQDRLIAQKRSERLAELMVNDAEAELEKLAAVDERIRARLFPLLEQKLIVLARINVLEAQLPDRRTGRPSTFIDPLLTEPDREAFVKEMAKLQDMAKQGQNLQLAVGISWRARLRYQRDQETENLGRLDAEINRVMREGGVALGNTSQALLEQRLREIDAELAKDRAGFLEQRRSLEAVLAAAVRAAMEKEHETSRLAGGESGNGRGPVRFDDLFGAAPAETVGAQTAADRVRRQRAALQRFIEQSTVDAVRDAAQARGIDVTVMRGASPGASPVGVKDRVDMTSDFAAWIRVGGQPSLSVGGGRV